MDIVSWKISLLKYIKVIADLVIIWEATHGLPHSICYSEYCEIKDQVCDHVINKLKKQIDLSPEKPTPSKDKPPPYTKVFPVVQRYQMEGQTPKISRPQNPSKSSRRTYSTTAPSPIDSIDIPVVNAYAAPDSMSISTNSDIDDEISWHDGKSQLKFILVNSTYVFFNNFFKTWKKNQKFGYKLI